MIYASTKPHSGADSLQAVRRVTLFLSLMILPYAAMSETLETLTAERQSVPERADFYGRIQAVNQATVSAETQGRVEDIQVDIGDSVTAGSVLLTMTSTEQRARLTQAEANLADAQSNLKTDEAEYQRISDLYKKNFVSKTEMDRASSRFNASKARVSSAEAAIKSAREQLSYTEIKAPYSGIVSDRFIEVGEAVRPGTLLLSGYNPSAFRVEVDIPQTVADKVRVLQLAEISVIGSDPSSTRAIVPDSLILYPTVDPATSSVRVRLNLPLNTPNLYPGQFVEVSFNTGHRERLLVPVSSVVYRSEVPAVYVVQDQRPLLRQIRPGAVYGEQIEVLAGVSTGELIAIDPVAAAEMMVEIKTAGE